MDHPLIYSSYAKINHFLHITGKRNDGFHNLQTIFQFVDLKDYLYFYPRYDNACYLITLNTNNRHLPNDNNLIHDAGQLLLPYASKPRPFHIELVKNIPLGGGLGGGSTNAATTLIALNDLWSCGLTNDELMQMAQKLGSDVPIFIHGHAAWAETTGYPVSNFYLPEKFILIGNPKLHIQTRELFHHPELKVDQSAILPEKFSFDATENVFEPIVKQQYPFISHYMALCEHYGKTRLTGTGSCFYVISAHKETLQHLSEKIKKELDTYLTKTLNSVPVQSYFQCVKSN
jgi:4-diphosphocytidyl-2-C-methyl-D-erythritol kinase